jgi:hypothetical protein
MGGRRITFLVLMGVAIYGIWSALKMPIGKIQDQGPGLFPLILSTLLLFLSILGLIFSKEEKGASLDRKKIWGEFRVPLRIVLLTLGAIYFWESLGFLIACPLFLFLLFFWASGYRLWKALAFGLAGGLIGWAFFIKLLSVAMPIGIFGF